MSRPTIAVFARPGTPPLGRDLLRCLAQRVDVRAGATPAETGSPRPGAVLLLGADLAGTVPPAWSALPHAELRGGPRAYLAVGSAVVEVPNPWVVAEDLLAVPPLVRRRRRDREGLPADLVIELDGSEDPSDAGHDDTTVLLGLAAAAVVRGRWLATALALGTPTVTAPADAARTGAQHDRNVLVVPDGSDPMHPRTAAPAGGLADDTGVDPNWARQARAAAEALASDATRAARLSRQATELRASLDLGRTAEALLEALGLDRAGDDGAGSGAAIRVTSALRLLGTSPGTPQRSRALAAVASLDRALVAHGGSSCP